MSIQRTEVYKVVINHEEQYSIWPSSRTNPTGWKDTGTTGSPETCISFIERVTADSNPRTLRERIAALGG